jgi:membrane protein DedA with SNARE-associated domain
MKLTYKTLKILALIDIVLIAFCLGYYVSSVVNQCGENKIFVNLILILAVIAFFLSYTAEKKKDQESRKD